ncbi:ferredoxin-dependent glutamate synthase [Streptomyces bingchenggensis BCW-1]|uniref:Ferredoxin-dependent glutamate synthase n=1 Tax=Streptomyces bingchenggensis (strain BCW-1) TaxID=749414 RepID=D7C685_STRBB|nr:MULTISPECIES: glutamate synthase-related protein [Streptomyces]ADI04073.1 ferredoxin-dependent glutamate synthase [Streptomyces bingchenggensis BCW-1]
MTRLSAPGLPEEAIRKRARTGREAAFPPRASYGRRLFGATGQTAGQRHDALDALRLVPPVFMPQRLEKLVELGREPVYQDVALDSAIGGFRSPLPVFITAFGSTRAASGDLGVPLSRQAARLGLPMVIGENIVPVNGYGRLAQTPDSASLLARISAYVQEVPEGYGGVVVQQCTEDADAEVWNLVYSDPAAQPLVESGRLAFELKVGQGAKPGLGGMTLVDRSTAEQLRDHYELDAVFGPGTAEAATGGDGEGASLSYLRSSSPGTFTEEILRQQVRLLRNNYPQARIWVKLHPGRDVAQAATVAWRAGADAVTVDGAEGGTGWAPLAFLDGVGLPLVECLHRIGSPAGDLLASGRMWEGSRAVKAIALGATAVGLGRAALLAVDEDTESGLERFVACLALELRLLIGALGKYSPRAVGREDIWPTPDPTARTGHDEQRSLHDESV